MTRPSPSAIDLQPSASAVLAAVALGATMLLAVPGCYELFFRPEDERNIRRQFHVPYGVPMVSFDSNPKSAGFFGREGLRIWAVFEFDSRQFENYVARLDDPTVWKPVRFLSYSPDRADEYSERSLRWSALPIPSRIEERLRRWQHMPDVLKVENGSYYCSAIVAERGDRVDHKGGGYHYQWDYLGKSCSERGDRSAVMLTFGVVDFERRRL